MRFHDIQVLYVSGGRRGGRGGGGGGGGGGSGGGVPMNQAGYGKGPTTSLTMTIPKGVSSNIQKDHSWLFNMIPIFAPNFVA